MSSRADPAPVPLLLLLLACSSCSGGAAPGSSSDARRDMEKSPIAVADPELASICDTVQRWTGATVPQVQRYEGQFTATVRGVTRWGCRLTATDSLPPDRADRPFDALMRAFINQHWTVDQDFLAESSDGAMAGVRSGTVVCVVQHYWQSHSDDDRAAERTEPYAYHLQLECFRDAPRPSR